MALSICNKCQLKLSSSDMEMAADVFSGMPGGSLGMKEKASAARNREHFRVWVAACR
jgi:hypothetical protein